MECANKDAVNPEPTPEGMLELVHTWEERIPTDALSSCIKLSCIQEMHTDGQKKGCS